MKHLLLSILLSCLVCLDALAQVTLVDSLVVRGSDRWWNAGAGLNPLRPAPPVAGELVYYFDLNGDGQPDMLRTVSSGGLRVQWIDDNGNMKIGDISGDLSDDCIMVDRNGDGQYGAEGDIVIDWVDTNCDCKADVQIIAS